MRAFSRLQSKLVRHRTIFAFGWEMKVNIEINKTGEKLRTLKPFQKQPYGFLPM
uniref:Uncharacterized protein n=2 Tax=Anguilla anguilla TaxID=7936 RepID=A0A0E9U4Y6_ANGAN